MLLLAYMLYRLTFVAWVLNGRVGKPHHELMIDDLRAYLTSLCSFLLGLTASNEDKIHGHNVLKISHLLANLCFILKITPEMIQSDGGHLASGLEGYANIFHPHSTNTEDPIDGDIKVWTDDTRKVSSEDLVFIWGFRGRMSAGGLKRLLQGSHSVFSEEFDVRMVDGSCAIVVFWQSGLSQTFLEAISSNWISGLLREMVSEGLRAAGYETYKNACRLGFWEADLADSLDKALAEPDHNSEADSEAKPTGPSQIYWSRDSIINLDEL